MTTLDEEINNLRIQTRSLLERNNRYYTEMQAQIPQSMKDAYRKMCFEHKELHEKLTQLEEQQRINERSGHNEGEIL